MKYLLVLLFAVSLFAGFDSRIAYYTITVKNISNPQIVQMDSVITDPDSLKWRFEHYPEGVPTPDYDWLGSDSTAAEIVLLNSVEVWDGDIAKVRTAIELKPGFYQARIKCTAYPGYWVTDDSEYSALCLFEIKAALIPGCPNSIINWIFN